MDRIFEGIYALEDLSDDPVVSLTRQATGYNLEVLSLTPSYEGSWNLTVRGTEDDIALFANEIGEEPPPATYCEHDWQEQPGEPPFDVCNQCGAWRW